MSLPASDDDLVVYPPGILRWRGRRFACAIGSGGVRSNKREGDGATPAGRFPPAPSPLPARPGGAAPHDPPHCTAEPAGRLVRRSRPPPLQRAAAPASPRPPRRAVARGSRLRSDRHTRPQRCARGAGLGQRGVPSRGATGLCADRRMRRGGGGPSVDDPGRRGSSGVAPRSVRWSAARPELARGTGPKYRGADPDVGGAERDRSPVVGRHAHAEAVEVVARGELPQ